MYDQNMSIINLYIKQDVTERVEVTPQPLCNTGKAVTGLASDAKR
jgi:hypothetical protein